MATLTDQTRQTLVEIEGQTRSQGENFTKQLKTSATSWEQAAASAKQAADRLDQAGRRLEWSHYLLVSLTALVTAVLVSGFWLWLAPPKVEVQPQLDAKAVAQLLKPAVIEALKPSRGR